MAEDKHDKDVNRYSWSRLKTFKDCPRKHHYIYVEQLPVPDNEFTLSGRLFHKCVELTLKGEDCTPVYEEFKQYCLTGEIKQEPDLLQYIVDEYFSYYGMKYTMENTLLVEQEMKCNLIDDDHLVMVLDQALEDNGYVGIRDMKTTLNSLKYTHDDVKLNQQLLLYVPYAEELLQRNIDFIEIDEVRLAKLKDVPLKSNGKPSTDKKLLSLVTYADYYDALCSQGLEKNQEYQLILDYLRERGHPLFNRIRMQLLDRKPVETNKEDLMETYIAASTDPKYKVKGPLCMYCPYKYLCEQDSYEVDRMTREKIIENIK